MTSEFFIASAQQRIQWRLVQLGAADLTQQFDPLSITGVQSERTTEKANNVIVLLWQWSQGPPGSMGHS